MSKAKVHDPEISDEYDFSKGKRGVYYQRAEKGIKISLSREQPGNLNPDRSRPVEKAGKKSKRRHREPST